MVQKRETRMKKRQSKCCGKCAAGQRPDHEQPPGGGTSVGRAAASGEGPPESRPPVDAANIASSGELTPPLGDIPPGGTSELGKPPAASPTGASGKPYWVTTWIEAQMRTVRMDGNEVLAIPAPKHKLFYNPAFGQILIARPSGRVIQCGSGLPGGGPTTLSIPFGLMTKPGRRMSPLELSILVGIGGLQIAGIFNQRLQAARRAFGEGGKAAGAEPIYFLCSEFRPYLTWWNPACTYAVIEPESWLQIARQYPGRGLVLFHLILFGETRLRDIR